eukprot:jgi/Mesvir1/27247/Mv07088-RA.1
MGGQQNQNWFLYLHTALLRVVCAMVRSVFPHSTIKCEDADGAALYSPNHRPDITVLDCEGQGCHLLIDVSVARLLSGRHILRAAVDAGAAAAEADASAPSLPPTAMWGPTGSSPLSLRSSGPWAPRQRSFSTSAASAVKTASTSRVRPAPWSARTYAVLVLAAAPVTRPHSHRG